MFELFFSLSQGDKGSKTAKNTRSHPRMPVNVTSATSLIHVELSRVAVYSMFCSYHRFSVPETISSADADGISLEFEKLDCRECSQGGHAIAADFVWLFIKTADLN